MSKQPFHRAWSPARPQIFAIMLLEDKIRELDLLAMDWKTKASKYADRKKPRSEQPEGWRRYMAQADEFAAHAHKLRAVVIKHKKAAEAEPPEF